MTGSTHAIGQGGPQVASQGQAFSSTSWIGSRMVSRPTRSSPLPSSHPHHLTPQTETSTPACTPPNTTRTTASHSTAARRTYTHTLRDVKAVSEGIDTVPTLCMPHTAMGLAATVQITSPGYLALRNGASRCPTVGLPPSSTRTYATSTLRKWAVRSWR